MGEKVVKRVGEVVHSVLTQREGGTPVHYRHIRQEMNPVFEHVRQMSEKNRLAPTVANRNDWHYEGSMPVTWRDEWLRNRGYTLDQCARNEDTGNGIGVWDLCKAEFLSDPSLNKFHAETYMHRNKRVYGGH